MDSTFTEANSELPRPICQFGSVLSHALRHTGPYNTKIMRSLCSASIPLEQADFCDPLSLRSCKKHKPNVTLQKARGQSGHRGAVSVYPTVGSKKDVNA